MSFSLYWKLSAFYAVYYVAVGAWVPYWPLYLLSLGYTPAQIGVALACTALVRVAVPVGWGWVMDRSDKRMPWIGGGMLAAALLFGLVPFSPNFGVLLGLHVAYAIFWNVALPAFDVVTLNHLSASGGEYARVRLWGSIGFIVAVAALGPILDLTGVGLVPWVVVGAMLLMVLLSLRIADVNDQRGAADVVEGFMARVRRPGVIALLFACFLSQLSFAPFYAFFSIYLEDHGYSRSAIGALWALGVIAEVFVFLYTARIIRRWGARLILILTLLSSALRWTLLALFVDSAVLLAISQVLHFMSFAVYHAVTVHYIHELFPGRMQGRGQALMAAVSFGLGGAVGSFVTGSAWDGYGPLVVYLSAACIALLGAVAARFAPRLNPAAVPLIAESPGHGA